MTNNTKIPITQKETILVGMKLCQTHYNKFIINEAYSLKHNETCSHPKHDEYKSQSKNANKRSKNLNLEEEINNNSNENNDENIQSILERLEQNIDNQFEILYQEWSNYDSL
jgi:hypothetical protein